MGRTKRIYTDTDKANVFVALKVNNGNIRRTARDTSIPESTVRDWRDGWESGEPEPDLELVEKSAAEFIDEAETVRDLALAELKRQIEAREVKPAQLVATVAVLEDKVRLGKGLATSRSETVHALPDPGTVMEGLREYLVNALEKQKEREQDIVDVGEADWSEVEPLALVEAAE